MAGLDDDDLRLSPGMVADLNEMSSQERGELEDFFDIGEDATAEEVAEAAEGVAAAAAGKRGQEMEEEESRPAKKAQTDDVAQEAAEFLR